MASATRNRTVRDDEPIFRLPPYRVEEVMVTASEAVDWGLRLFHIPDFWRQTQGEGVKVAVLDTGADFTHPDLQGSFFDAQDFTGSPYGPHDVQGHGTHVAGTIGARQDQRGVVGVAPKTKLLIGKVLGDNGAGSARSVADGILWAVEKKADIISMSLGSGSPSDTIHEAVKTAVAAGVFVICAAGNEGPRLDTVGYPGAFPETVAVGSIDRRKKVSRFSSRGSQVDVVAPGDQVLSTYPPRTYATLSGTSMATPFVSGVVALMVAKHREHGGGTPMDTQQQLLEHLRKTAIDAGPDGVDPSYGWGLINPQSLLMGDAARCLRLLAAEDLTENGWKKLEQFIGGQLEAPVSGETYLEGTLRDGHGEVRGGIRIRF